MQTKPGSETWIDPDDAPPLSAEMMASAEVFHGDTPVRRGRGRPSTGNARELISVRLDADLVAKLRAAGPGWQSQINPLLRAALQLDQVADEAVPAAAIRGVLLRAAGRIRPMQAASAIPLMDARPPALAKTSKPARRAAKVRTGKPHLSGSHER